MEAVLWFGTSWNCPATPGRVPHGRIGIWPKGSGKIRKMITPNTFSMKSPEFHGTVRFLAVLSDLGTRGKKLIAIKAIIGNP